MTKDGLTRIPHPNSAKFLTTALAAFALAGAALFTTQAWAQSSDIGDEVVVDLSVLGDGGIGGRSGGTMNSGGGNLLLPPRMAPASILYVAPMSGTKLRQPSATSMAKRKRPAVKSVTKAKSAPAPIKKQVAAAVPAPPSAPPKPPVAAPERPAKAIPAAPKMAAAPPPPPPSPKPAVTAAAELKPELKPAPKPAPKQMTAAPKQVEQAAIPKGIDLKPGRALRLEFAIGESKLTAAAKSDLKLISDKVRDDTKFRVQLLAFAGGKDLSPSKARRMSLARALSVRSQLIESGLRSTQIDVRALGDKTTDKPVNRVDLNFVER